MTNALLIMAFFAAIITATYAWVRSCFMNLFARTRRKFCLALLFPLLLVFSLLTFVGTATSRATVNAQPVRARVVQGVLRGGQLAQIWLGLAPEFADAQIKVIAEWDRLFPAANGLNFFIFDDQQLRRLDDGRTSFSAIALAAGSPHFELDTPDHAIGAGFNATGWASYALVLINESTADAAFTLRVTNAFIIDTAAQVRALDEAAPPTPGPDLPTTVSPPTAFLTTPGFITTTTFFTPWAPVPPTTTATALVTTTPVTATVTPPPALTTTQTMTITPLARTGLGQNKRLTRVNGLLTAPTAQQILRLQPAKAKGQILLRLVANEQGPATPETADALNFWVFDEAGFSQYLTGAAPSAVAVSAGKRVFRSAPNERAAGFRTASVEPYTVVIYSDATRPVSYTFSVEGAQVAESFYLP